VLLTRKFHTQTPRASQRRPAAGGNGALDVVHTEGAGVHHGAVSGTNSDDRQPTRDRDAAGRAHSARPRDGLGRPLPHGAEGVARQPEGVVRTPDETLAEAQRLLDEGMPFHAHEVFEDAWKSTAAPGERALWKGLAQLAVGITHAARGNGRGAVALLRRAADAIESAAYAVSTPLGLPRLR
jgi:uncharacterized protein